MSRKRKGRAARAEAAAGELRLFVARLRAGEEDSEEVEVSEIQSLMEELEEWKENMPENLQGGDKHDQLEEAIQNLQDIITELESLDFSDKNEDADTIEAQAEALENVEFPGMF